MPETAGRFGKAQMSDAERRQRSRCMQLLREAGLLRGSLFVRERRCGKPTCRCAKGEGHPGLVVQFKDERRTRQIHVPKAMEAEIRVWVEQYQEIQRRIEQISMICQGKIKTAKRSSKKGG